MKDLSYSLKGFLFFPFFPTTTSRKGPKFDNLLRFFFYFFFIFNFRTYKDIFNSFWGRGDVCTQAKNKDRNSMIIPLSVFVFYGILKFRSARVSVHSFLRHKKTFCDSWSGYGKENHPTRGQITLRTNRDKTIGLNLFAAAIVTSALLK